MINPFKIIIDKIFGPDPEPQPPLSPEELAAAERFLFEIFAQQKADAWKPVGTVLFSPRLRRSNPQVYNMDRAMTSLLEKGWVETQHIRYLVLTDAGYAHMQTLNLPVPK